MEGADEVLAETADLLGMMNDSDVESDGENADPPQSPSSSSSATEAEESDQATGQMDPDSLLLQTNALLEESFSPKHQSTPPREPHFQMEDVNLGDLPNPTSQEQPTTDLLTQANNSQVQNSRESGEGEPKRTRGDLNWEELNLSQCNVREISMVSCGAKIDPQEVFLLDSAIRMEIRQDISNSFIMTLCSHVLSSNGYHVQTLTQPPTLAKLEASFEIIESSHVANEKQTESSHVVNDKQTESTDKQTESTQVANDKQGQTVSTTAVGCNEKNEDNERHLADWARRKMEQQSAYLSKAFSFSVGKINHALSSVDAKLPLPLARLAEEKEAKQDQLEERKVQKVAILVLGVETSTKSRVLLLSGLENNTDDVLREIHDKKLSVACAGSHFHIDGIEIEEQFTQLLSEDYLYDLKEAFRVWMEQKLVDMTAERELNTRKLEWKAAQLVSLVRASYKKYGVSAPTLERPPVVSQLSLEYESDPVHEDLVQSGCTVLEAVNRVKASLQKGCEREIVARFKRKIKQIEIREKVCARNRHAILAKLASSHVAVNAELTRQVADVMKIEPSVILGTTSAFFEKRPGNLMITLRHILFSANLLGFRTNLAIPLSECSAIRKESAQGVASFVGDAALVVRIKDGSEISFLVSSLLESERIIELLEEIVVYQSSRNGEDLNKSLEEKSHDDTELQRLSHQEGEPEQHQEKEKEEVEDDGELEIDRQAVLDEQERERVMTMKKMMASTLLQPDEEEF